MMAKDEKTEQDEPQEEPRERTESEKRAAKIERGNRRVAQAEAELAEDREEKIREGMVFDDMAPSKDDPRRRLKVLAVEGDDDDGQVLVENLSTYQHSRIRADRLLSEAFQRSV